MQALSKQEVAQNVSALQEQICQAATAAGRDPAQVRLMAVTKTVDPELVNAAIDAGITLLGENKAQELCAKYDSYHKDGVEIHFIGHLQTNKVRQIVDKVQMIESVDSLPLAEEINKRCAALNKQMPILIEVNIGREESKSGVLPEDLPALLEEISKLPAVSVRGLMAIPPVCENNEQVSQYFYQIQQLFIDIKQKKYDNINMEILSMGMSGDYQTAIAYGSNVVRIGTAMFGQRNYKRS
ncbi:MAG: YggS family pyridoxal phosphate-dependent enzyme [Negativibacillus sp.]|nr:YggS family pyridoxal phosphate-dependent enzyme [Negativibacillus sp.]